MRQLCLDKNRNIIIWGYTINKIKRMFGVIDKNLGCLQNGACNRRRIYVACMEQYAYSKRVSDAFDVEYSLGGYAWRGTESCYNNTVTTINMLSTGPSCYNCYLFYSECIWTCGCHIAFPINSRKAMSISQCYYSRKCDTMRDFSSDLDWGRIRNSIYLYNSGREQFVLDCCGKIQISR